MIFNNNHHDKNAAVTRFVGFKPYFHQRSVIDEIKDSRGTGKIVVCKSSRQKGKSTMIANLLLYFAINYSFTNNYCLSPTLKQGKNLYKTVLNAIEKSNIVKSKNSIELSITLINNSTINFKSAEQKNGLRGFTADFLCIDEAAFIPDDIFFLVLPWVDAKKAPVLIVSTPFLKSGFFYNYYNYGLELSHNTVTIDWSDEKYKESIRQVLSEEKLEEYRKILPKNVFKTEYLGEFLDDDGTVFINYTSCIENNKIKPTDLLYVGIDWSNVGGNDYTVISIFNQYGKQVYLSYYNQMSPLKQIERILKELEPYAKQIDVISCESNSIGTPYIDLLRERSQILSQKVKPFLTTNSSKNSIVTNMQVALEQRQVKVLPDEKQKREFGFFTAIYNPATKNVSYSAPVGLHDDTVMATLIAYNAYKERNKYGKYNIR